MAATLNGKSEIYFSVDTMASKSVVTEGTLDKLRLEIPVATQRLRQPVRFQLAADNSDVKCREIAYVDFSITAERRPISLQAVPFIVLPGPKGYILHAKEQQEELGLTSTRRLMAQAADNLRSIARDPLDTNGALIAAAGKPVQKLMRLTLVGEEESMEEDETLEESEHEDLPEEGLVEENLRRDSSAEMAP